MLGIQDLMGKPNAESPAQAEPYNLFVKDVKAYEAKVREFAAANKPTK